MHQINDEDNSIKYTDNIIVGGGEYAVQGCQIGACPLCQINQLIMLELCQIFALYARIMPDFYPLC